MGSRGPRPLRSVSRPRPLNGPWRSTPAIPTACRYAAQDGAGPAMGNATTHWLVADLFCDRLPRVALDPIVCSSTTGTLTSAGAASGIDVCLHIVRKDHGSEVAKVIPSSRKYGSEWGSSRSGHIRAAPRRSGRSRRHQAFGRHAYQPVLTCRHTLTDWHAEPGVPGHERLDGLRRRLMTPRNLAADLGYITVKTVGTHATHVRRKTDDDLQLCGCRWLVTEVCRACIAG